MYVAKRIRDPLHNLISFDATEFEDIIWRAIQTRPFQRLRRIRQLGFSDFVYPGATHSRFAHSVGVFHTARQLMKIIHNKVGDANWSLSKSQAALAAALVHDVGHGPFSHAFEAIGKRLSLKLADHEYVSDYLIRNSEISEPLMEISSGFHNDVAAVIAAKGPRSVYDAVVSSQFDADRLDYMRRDRIMAGSSHGVIDYDWLVSNLEVHSIKFGVDAEEVNELQTFVIGPKGVWAAESYVLGLFHLYPTIYFHKGTRGIEKLFTELMVKVFELVIDGSMSKTGLPDNHPIVQFAKNPTDAEAALCLDDTVVLGALSMLAESSEEIISKFALRIRDRNLLKCFDVREAVRKRVIEKEAPKSGGFDQTARLDVEKSVGRITLAAADKIEMWKKANPEKLLLQDRASRPPYKRFEESKGPLNQIMVRNTDGNLVDLAEHSSAVRAIPTFELFRYYYERDDDEIERMINAIIDGEMSNGV